jgi:transposase
MGTLNLTTWQRRRLERQLRDTGEARVFRRTLAVLEVDQGEPVAVVARRLRVTPRVVYYWIEAYPRGHDPEALRGRDRSGRPRLLSPADRAQLLDMLQHSPQDFGYFATTWTVPLLQEHLARCVGLHLSEDTLHRELDRLDYAWKRPRYLLDPDPELRGKKETPPPADQAVATADRGAGRGRNRSAAVSPVRAAWSPRGQAKRVLLSGRNARRTVFGAMNLRTGRRLFLAREHQRAADFQAFLRVVHHCYRGWHVALLLDEDPSHTAKGSVQLADRFDSDRLWLPKRSPQLNPLDTLWGQGKDVISADTQ